MASSYLFRGGCPGVDVWEPVKLASPELDLIASMVERAILDLDSPEKHIRKEAVQWLTSKKDKPWSFRWCMTILDHPDDYTVYIARLVATYAKGQNKLQSQGCGSRTGICDFLKRIIRTLR